MVKADPDPDMVQLQEQIAILRADIARIAETLALLGQTSGETLREALTAKAEQLRAEGEAQLAEAGRSTEAALADVTDYARRNPVQALAMAGGLGMVFGLLFGRR